MKKTVAVIVASQGFQPHEYAATKKIIESAGHNVLVVSDKKGTAQSSDGKQIKVDLSLPELFIDDVDAIVIIGGPQTLEHLDTNKMYRVIQDAAQERLVIGAICLATRVLAKSGVLAGHAATGWDGDNALADIYRHHGVSYTQQPVVVDGVFVTAQGPQAAEDFGTAIIELL